MRVQCRYQTTRTENTCKVYIVVKNVIMDDISVHMDVSIKDEVSRRVHGNLLPWTFFE